MLYRYSAFVCFLLLVPLLAFAQVEISGTVTDAGTNEPLPGASVMIKGTTMGAAADAQGNYRILNVPPGTYTLRASFLGYLAAVKSVTVGSENATVNFALTETVITGQEVTVFASRAIERETPVAFTDVSKEKMEATLGSRDIPLVLNSTPSVYATQQGGGAGDARINVRGFDQRNVVIMINGVPTNDMENGWLYWSNWDGVADATSSIQMQRGLSATNLAVPSIGGTMNIITDPAALEKGAKYKQEIGNDGFVKSTLMLNSGLINDKFALTGLVVRKTGDGLIDKTWTDAWAYYFGASYQINSNNRLELYALGAPQRHGQNLYKQNIGAISREFAESLEDYDPAALDKYKEVGRRYNQNWGPVSSSYKGQQWLGDDLSERHSEGFINERENFYHKPQVNLNWFSKFTNQFGLYSTIYYSGGHGGGTGTLGSIKWDYSGPSRTPDWDATIARNDTSSTGSTGILRNSRNNQWTIGAISKAIYDVNESVRLTAGVDWRTAEIEHYREVRDLLGGDYYYSTASDFWTEAERRRKLGDKVNYFFTNTVDWIGVTGQAEYSKGQISAYGMTGYSTVKYTYTNHFRDDGTGKELTAETDNIGGFQIKGGASYRISEAVHVYGNAGFISKVPIFDNVISDRTGTKAENPENEKFTSFEAGVNFRSLDGKLGFKASGYHTIWKDRTRSIGTRNAAGSDVLIFLSGMDVLHQGLEFEADFQPNRFVRLVGSASIGDWKFTNDVSGLYKDYSDPRGKDIPFNFYVKDLKDGDAPQTQFFLAGIVSPVEELQAQVELRHYRDHYAQWDPFGRIDPADRAQSWKAPNYTVVDFHASYDLPIDFGGIKPQLFAHVFNVFDELYIQDAVDNSRFNSFDKDHDADDAEVFFGLPRSWNIGFRLSY